jgi:hypothetical protein
VGTFVGIVGGVAVSLNVGVTLGVTVSIIIAVVVGVSNLKERTNALYNARGELVSVISSAQLPSPTLGAHLRSVFFTLSHLIMYLLLAGWLLLEPPERLPDLYPVLFALFGAANLLVAYVYFVYRMYVVDKRQGQGQGQGGGTDTRKDSRSDTEGGLADKSDKQQ